MPRASVRTATTVNPGVRRRARMASRRSWQSAIIVDMLFLSHVCEKNNMRPPALSIVERGPGCLPAQASPNGRQAQRWRKLEHALLRRTFRSLVSAQFCRVDDVMEPESPPDLPGTKPPDGVSTNGAPEAVPAAAEALFPSVPVEALPPVVPTDQVLAQPTPAEALLGTDPAVLLSTTTDLGASTEVAVPSLEEVVAPSLEKPGTADDCLAGGGHMGARMRAFDWAQTPLGPVAEWPQPLRTAVSIMLGSGFPMLIVWGPEYIQVYNDAYLPVLGATKHPAALGQRAADCWPEIWNTMLAPMFQQVMSTGEPFQSEDRLFVLDRHGYLEETYFTFSYSAIRDDTGRPGGVLVTSVETTGRVLGERRLRTLHELAYASRSDTVSAACQIVASTLAANPNDLPFALLYFIDKDRLRAGLCASSHIAIATQASPETIDLCKDDEDDAVWPIARVARTDQSEVVSNPG